MSSLAASFLHTSHQLTRPIGICLSTRQRHLNSMPIDACGKETGTIACPSGTDSLVWIWSKEKYKHGRKNIGGGNREATKCG